MSNTILASLAFLNIAFIGLATGGAMAIAVGYSRMFAELPQQETVIVHQGLGKYIDPYQPRMAMIGLVAGVAELFFSEHVLQTVFLLLGTAGIIILTIISRMISVPLSHRIAVWTPAIANEAPLEVMKKKWILAHYIRSTFAVLGFLFFIVAAMFIGRM